MIKLKNQLQDLINKYGYWSNEVLKFNSKLDFNIMNKVNNLVNKNPTNQG